MAGGDNLSFGGQAIRDCGRAGLGVIRKSAMIAQTQGEAWGMGIAVFAGSDPMTQTGSKPPVKEPGHSTLRRKNHRTILHRTKIHRLMIRR